VQDKGGLIADPLGAGHGGRGLFVAEGFDAGGIVGPAGAHFDPHL
jgi:hypothetical protein